MGLSKLSDKKWRAEFDKQLAPQLESGADIIVLQASDKTRVSALNRVPEIVRIMAEHGFKLKQTDNTPLAGGWSRFTGAMLTFERSAS